MNISAKELAYKKRIGKTSKGRTLFGVGTIGGLHMVVAVGGGKMETLGAASHPALARHIASKNDSDVEFDDLAKSEQIDPIHFGDLLESYIELTNQIREAQSGK
jgi:hypothetical protein